MHMVSVAHEQGEITEALRLADDVDISQIPSLERQTSHLYQVAQCYACRGNDTAVFVHLKIAERLGGLKTSNTAGASAAWSPPWSSVPSRHMPLKYGNSRDGSAYWTDRSIFALYTLSLMGSSAATTQVIRLDGSGQHQIRPPDVTSYCHCSSLQPKTLLLPSCPRSFC